MDKNVKRGLTGKAILPDVVWHVFSVVSGGYNKVIGGRLYSPTSSSSIRLRPGADIGHVFSFSEEQFMLFVIKVQNNTVCWATSNLKVNI